MKRYLSLIAATAALGVAAAAYAGPAEPAGAQPADQPTATSAPSTDPSAPSDQPSSTDPQSVESSAAQSSTAAGPSTSDSTRLAEASPSSMSMQEACTGFKTQKECAATVHASQNLGIPFADLKSKVTGGEKLGKAIKELKPDADAKAEARKAEHQARSDSSTPSG
jgi:hypothetical protein